MRPSEAYEAAWHRDLCAILLDHQAPKMNTVRSELVSRLLLETLGPLMSLSSIILHLPAKVETCLYPFHAKTSVPCNVQDLLPFMVDDEEEEGQSIADIASATSLPLPGAAGPQDWTSPGNASSMSRHPGGASHSGGPAHPAVGTIHPTGLVEDLPSTNPRQRV